MTSTIETIVEAVKEWSGMDDADFRDVARHGADTGWPKFTYYSDTCGFFESNQSEIVALVKERAEEFGSDPISMVAGFNCLTDDAETRDEIGRCIYGNVEDDDVQVPNALAWFALEETAYYLESFQGLC